MYDEPEEKKPEQKVEKKAKAEKGITEQTIKELIQKELETAAKETFNEVMMASQPEAQEPESEEQLIDTSDKPASQNQGDLVEHTNVQCDGCLINPIKGIRYKCSVMKNFDYCAACEAKFDHPHPFLKIAHPS